MPGRIQQARAHTASSVCARTPLCNALPTGRPCGVCALRPLGTCATLPRAPAQPLAGCGLSLIHI
eukprot:9244568-Alexandrium_andersonii.AAC.1